MIRYENIDPEDMRRYWGQGYVFLQWYKDSGSRAVWNAYTVTTIDETVVQLKLALEVISSGLPPRRIDMSYTEFFRQAMLHRPSLGVLVREDGKVYGLGWQHANGQEMAKAIRAPDVFVKPLLVDEPAPEKKLAAWPDEWAKTLAGIRGVVRDGGDAPLATLPFTAKYAGFIRGYSLLAQHGQRVQRGREAGHHNDAINLVLEFLNQEPTTISAVLPTLGDKPVYLDGTAWLKPLPDLALLMNGEYDVGSIRRSDGRFIPSTLSDSRGLIGERLFKSLL